MKLVGRMSAIALAIGVAGFAAPGSAQFFLKHHDVTGQTVTGSEPGIGAALPGATPAEQRAGLVWTMRAGLNVAALQCQFEPTLQTVGNYNAILIDHQDELKRSFTALAAYFVRVNKTKAAGQAALDQFSTRIYSSFATVNAQYNFCPTANAIGRDALFQPPGTFGDLAAERMQELRNSLVPWGEQSIPRYARISPPQFPRLDEICWSKDGEWVEKKCGAQNWPPATATGTGVAAR